MCVCDQNADIFVRANASLRVLCGNSRSRCLVQIRCMARCGQTWVRCSKQSYPTYNRFLILLYSGSKYRKREVIDRTVIENDAARAPNLISASYDLDL